MHYYQFNIGDYHSHTSHLDEIEDLAYRRMLDYCYLNEIGLPKSVEEVSRLIRMRTHCDCIANVLREFFVLDGAVYRSVRVEEELEIFRERSNKASSSAKLRWAKTKGFSDAKALPTQCEGNANQEPRTNNHKPRTNTKAQAPEDVNSVFDYWVNTMNSPNSKLTADRKAKIKARLKTFSVDDLCRAIDGCKRSEFHMGKNDRNTAYNSIEFICRNDSKIEFFHNVGQSTPDYSNFLSNGFEI